MVPVIAEDTIFSEVTTQVRDRFGNLWKGVWLTPG
jgi:hypothetical protein